jgi:6-phosphogluconolactonase
VLVTLADERWVAAVDQDSNERLVRECLVDPTGAAFLSLRGHEDECSEALLRLDAQLACLGTRSMLLYWAWEATGHTASLFPKAANLAELMELENQNNCALVDPVTAPHLRITQTLSRLLSSQQVVIHITGAAKRDVLGQAWDAEGFADWPIVSVLKQSSCTGHYLY